MKQPGGQKNQCRGSRVRHSRSWMSIRRAPQEGDAGTLGMHMLFPKTLRPSPSQPLLTCGEKATELFTDARSPSALASLICLVSPYGLRMAGTGL